MYSKKRYYLNQIQIARVVGIDQMEIKVDGNILEGNVFAAIEKGNTYEVLVKFPE